MPNERLKKDVNVKFKLIYHKISKNPKLKTQMSKTHHFTWHRCKMFIYFANKKMKYKNKSTSYEIVYYDDSRFFYCNM
jgi:hypothetical protein